MPTKLYLTNSPGVTWTGAAARGAWDQNASGAAVVRLGGAAAGAATSAAAAETNTNTAWDVLLVRAVSDGLTAQTLSGTLDLTLAALESNAAADMQWHVHAWVTQGDSQALRGTLLADSIVATEWPTTAQGVAITGLALSSVAAQAGDRIVLEVGYRATNAVSTSYTGTLYYGGTGTDLAAGGTDTTRPGFATFSGTVLTVPDAPAAPAATVIDAFTADVTWAAVPGATGYTVQRRSTTQGQWWACAPVQAGTTFRDRRLAPLGEYAWRVRAENANGASAFSAASAAVTTPDYAPPPVDIYVSPTGNAANTGLTPAQAITAAEAVNRANAAGGEGKCYGFLDGNYTLAAPQYVGRSGTADARTVFRSVNKYSAAVAAVSSWAFSPDANGMSQELMFAVNPQVEYVDFWGLAVDAAGKAPNPILLRGSRNNRIIDCFGTGGTWGGFVSAATTVSSTTYYPDYITWYRNSVWKCGYQHGFSSGISAHCHRDSSGGTDPGIHSYIVSNVVMGMAEAGLDPAGKTDGNGIIVDNPDPTGTFSVSPSQSTAILIANNICAMNAGRGIHSLNACNVYAINNLTWRNALDLGVLGGSSGSNGEFVFATDLNASGLSVNIYPIYNLALGWNQGHYWHDEDAPSSSYRANPNNAPHYAGNEWEHTLTSPTGVVDSSITADATRLRRRDPLLRLGGVLPTIDPTNDGQYANAPDPRTLTGEFTLGPTSPARGGGGDPTTAADMASAGERLKADISAWLWTDLAGRRRTLATWDLGPYTNGTGARLTAARAEALVRPSATRARLTAAAAEALVLRTTPVRVTQAVAEALVKTVTPTLFPQLLVEVAFANDPGDTVLSWTDVGPYCRSIATRRGRQDETNQIEAGTLTVTLRDDDGRFFPQFAGSPYSPNVLPAKRIRVRATFDGVAVYPLFSGFVEDWRATWPDQLFELDATVIAADATKLLAGVGVTASFPAQYSHERVTQLLDAIGWSGPSTAVWVLGSSALGITTYLAPAGDRVIGQGASFLQPKAMAGESGLSHLKAVDLTEQGLSYVDPRGRYVFIGRNELVGSPRYTTVQGTFGDGGEPAEIPYAEITVAFDDVRLWNEVVVTRDGGAPQTAGDATRQRRYFRRTLTRTGLLMTTDEEAKGLADWLLLQYREPRIRITRMVLKGIAEPGAGVWPHILGRDIGDRVRVIRRMPHLGLTLDQELVIQGVQHSVERTGVWTAAYNLAPALTGTTGVIGDLWIVDQSRLGINTRLSY